MANRRHLQYNVNVIHIVYLLTEQQMRELKAIQ